MGLIDPIILAYSRLHIHTAPRGTIFYYVHRMVRAGYYVVRPKYDEDGLRSIHNHDFMSDPAFVRAYQRGVQAASDLHWHWRVHVGLWAARLAARLPGDFVECGVNRGFLSSAIMKDLDWDKTGRRFYLLDTFSGRLDELYVSVEEKKVHELGRNRRARDNGSYTTDVEAVRTNFAEWKNVSIIVGAVPETLEQIDSQCIAFLHIDMNCSLPEGAAIRHLWDRLTPGAPVLLDDYAYHGFELQKIGMDAFATERGLSILSLPTGQGLLVKPP